MKVTVDFEREGLPSIFKEWEINTIKYLMSRSDTTVSDLMNDLGEKSRITYGKFLDKLDSLKIVIQEVKEHDYGWVGVYNMNNIESEREVMDMIQLSINNHMNKGEWTP